MGEENGGSGDVEMIARASRQPRFGQQDEETVSGVMHWAYRAHLKEPRFQVDTREYDDWLITFAQYEPHLSGILASVTSNDKNRGWFLTGELRQVQRFSDRLRNVEEGAGWRRFISKQSLAYWNTNMGAVTEVEAEDGVLKSLYHVDPTRVKLVRNAHQPLRYYPWRGKMQRWYAEEFFRTVSMPDIREQWMDIGYCAVNRCMTLAKMMVALYEHDLEQLGAEPAKGFLVGDGITQKMYEEAKLALKKARENGEDSLNVMVLFGSGAGAKTDVRFVPYSTVPTHIESLEQWTRLLLYGYALCFTYDAQEFYPVQTGSFGRGEEAELQAEKAAAKGALGFILDFQDNLQRLLPDTLDFQFDRNDPKITLQRVEVEKAVVGLYKELYAPPPGLAEGAIDKTQFQMMLAEHDIIPPEWTEAEEDAIQTDVERVRRWARDNDRVRRAAEKFPRDPIVRYVWPSHKVQTLYPSGEQMLRRIFYPAAKPSKLTAALERWRTRQQSLQDASQPLQDASQPHRASCGCASCRDAAAHAEAEMRQRVRAGKAPRLPSSQAVRRTEDGEVLYEDEDSGVVITTGDVEAAIAEAEDISADWFALLKAKTVERAFEWVSSTKRYRDTETGRFISASTVRDWAQGSLDVTSNNASLLAERVAGGELSPADWNALFREDIKREYIRQYIAGRGGQGNMTASDWGSLGGMLAEQYRYLDAFAAEIAEGSLTVGQIGVRARMYIASAREAYERANARAYGVVGLPYYPGDGSTACLTNCKCYWDIQEVRDEDGNLRGWHCTWRLTARESCDTCIGRAGDYAPLFIAG